MEKTEAGPKQCRINLREVLVARGAAAPEPAIGGSGKLVITYRSVRDPHLAQHPGPHYSLNAALPPRHLHPRNSD